MNIFKILETSYENFDNTMRNFLSKTFGELGQYYTKGNIFGTLLEAIKGVTQNIMFYIEDAMTEQNIFTAMRKKSIMSLAKVSGYDVWYGSPAVGTITIKNTIGNELDSGSTSIYIPDETVIKCEGNEYEYSLILEENNCYINTKSTLVVYDVKIVQGKWNSSIYTATGEPIQTFEISVKSLWNKDYIKVHVNGNECTVYDCFYDMTGYGYECVIQSGYKNDILLMFGDGTYGRQLQEGDTVTVKYLEHNGEYGNILASDTQTFKFVSSIYDGFGNELDGNDYLLISLSSHVCGGTNSDDYDNIKNMIGYNSRSNVIASEDNFKLFLSRFSFIGQSTIYTEANSLYVVAACLQKQIALIDTPSKYLEMEPSDIVLTDEQKDLVKDSFSISNKSFAGLSLELEDPIVRQYAIICYIKTNTSYNKESIKVSITEAIAEYFVNLTNVTFIAKSDIVKTVIDKVDSIQSFDCDIISKDNELGWATGYWYKQELRCSNGIWKHNNIKQIYDYMDPVGLDLYGNISISENLEIPFLHGGFKYYPNKDENDTTTSITIDTLQFHFI